MCIRNTAECGSNNTDFCKAFLPEQPNDRMQIIKTGIEDSAMKKLVCPTGTNKFIEDNDLAGESVRPDQMASGGIGGFGPKYFSISALLRPKAFFVKSHSRVGRFRITFRRRSTRFCQYL